MARGSTGARVASADRVRLLPLEQLAPVPGGVLHHIFGATTGFSPTVAAVLYAVYASFRLVSLFLFGNKT